MRLKQTYYIIIFIVGMFPVSLSAQNSTKVDSLLIVWGNKKNSDSLRLKAIKSLVMDCFITNNSKKSLLYLDQQIKFAKKVNSKFDIANGIAMKGYYYFSVNDLNSALPFYRDGLKLYEELDNKAGMSSCINNLGIIFRRKGDLDKAIEYYLLSSKLDLEIGDEKAYAKTNSNIGAIFFIKEEFETAQKYFNESLKLSKKHEDKRLELTCLMNLGDIAYELNHLEKANEFFLECIEISLMIDDKQALSKSYNLLGAVYTKHGKASNALKYHNKAIQIGNEVGDEIVLHTAYLGVGELEFQNDNFNAAIKSGITAYDLASKNNLIEGVARSSQLLYRSYKRLGEVNKALLMLEVNQKSIDSLRNETKHDELLRLQYQYEYERKATLDSLSKMKSDEIKILKLNEQERELKTKSKEKWFLVIGLLILVGVLLFIYNRYNLIWKQKRELTNAHEELAETSKELHDSIAYAELIQQAVLPTLKIEDLTKESFIYFNPKEKVSGDFYWIEQKDEYHGYAVADCTGHGIPGAFISMVGTILLNEIYNSKQIHVPNEILDELSRLVRLTLTNKEGYTMKDGMDISFAVLDNNTKMLYFAGANNPVWIVSKNPHKRINKAAAIPLSENEELYLYEIKGDRQPIGEYGDRAKPFTLNSAHLEEGDAFYLFSDGFVDQFGGEKGKKFKARPFREYLLSIYNQSMEEQEISLSSRFASWRGELEQIDDVTIMGVRV